MRILLVGWAYIEKQAAQGSGYNLVASDLGRGLAQVNGLSISYLNSGLRYTTDFKVSQPRIVFRREWQNVECFEVLNSPVLAPGLKDFWLERRARVVALFADVLAEFVRDQQFDLIHVQSFEGFGIEVFSELRCRIGVPIFVTPHDWYPLCPQVNLLYQGRYPCIDFRNGKKCESCVRPQNHDLQKLRSMLESAPQILRGTVEKLWQLSKGILAQDEFETFEQYQDILDKSANTRFVASLSRTQSCNRFSNTRVRHVEMLSAFQAILPPSEFMKEAYRSAGVNADKLRWYPLGLEHLDYLRSTPLNKPLSGNIRFCYLGTTAHTKGLHVLIKALQLLPSKTLESIEFLICAQGLGPEHLRALAEIKNLKYSCRSGYEIKDLFEIGKSYDVGVLPHTWFENSPIVLLEHQALGKPVIASALGGPREMIKDGETGWFFEPGSAADLKRAIVEVCEGGRIALPNGTMVRQSMAAVSRQEYVHRHVSLYSEGLQNNMAEYHPKGESKNKGASLIGNIFTLFILQGSNYLVPLVTLPYLVRVLGPQSYGLISFVVAFVAHFTMIVDYGFNISATNRLAKLKRDLKVSTIFISEIYLTKFALLGFSLAMAAVGTILIPTLREEWRLVAVSLLAVVGQALVPQWVFIATEKMRLFAVVVLIPRLLTIPLIFLLVQNQGDYLVAQAIQSFSVLISGLFGFFVIRHLFHWTGFRRSALVLRLNEGWPVFLAQISSTLYTSSNAFFLGLMSSTAAVGYYSGSWKVIVALQGLMWPITQAVFPRMSALSDGDQGVFQSRLKKLLLLMFVLGAVLSTFTFLLADKIVFVILGNEFSESSMVLKWMSPTLFLVATSHVLGIQGMIPLNLHKQFSSVVICGALLNLLLVIPFSLQFAELGPVYSMLIVECLIVLAMTGILLSKGRL